jgi:hypothetical protein
MGRILEAQIGHGENEKPQSDDNVANPICGKIRV